MDIDLEQLADAPYVSKSQVTEPKAEGAVGGAGGGPDARKSEERHHSRERSSRREDRSRRHDSRDRDRRGDDRRDHRRDERRESDRSHGGRRRSRSPRRDSRHQEAGGDSRSNAHASTEVDRAHHGGSNRQDQRRPSPVAPISEEERDQRTVFVQQLAQRLRTKELIKFFEKAGPVRDAQIVKDKISGRSKGVGYVEFRSPESLPAALQLTGQKLLGIPVIAQLTEAEKNRQAREEAIAQGKLPGRVGDVPFHRLYVGNIHFNVGEEDLQAVFEPFGDLEFVSLQKDPESGRSRGYGFVQFKDAAHAREALEKMNGFDLAGRPIRVGLGNDKFNPEATQATAQGRFSSKDFERDNGPPQRRDRRDDRDRDEPRGGGGGGGEGGRRRGERGIRELDDSEQGGVSFQNISRNDLMMKLARAEDNIDPSTSVASGGAMTSRSGGGGPPPGPQQASRGVLLKNMFNPAEETDPNWQKELGDDVSAECDEKYGQVVHCHVEENSLGEIYVKFKTLEGGKAAIEGLNGRWFGGKTIGAEPLLDAIYNTKFPEARGL